MMKNLRRFALIPTAFFGLCLTLQTALAATVFLDVASDHPNFESINALHDKGVIQGYADNTFRPDQPVNRAEILKVILLGSNILVPEIQNQTIFPDVDATAWYGKYVSKAKNLGIVKGDGTTGLFRPGDTVNLAEALKILLLANNQELPTVTSNPYADVAPNAWFAPYFEFARLGGLLDTKPEENALPAKPVTRGLLVELMYRLSKSNVLISDGKASYYGALFHGKTTSNGEVFDASKFTAAHRTYPFNTWLLVTNLENGKSVTVRVNDRGPYVTDPTRIIDLSQAAFESISALSRGIIEVKIETTTAPETVPTPTTPTETTTTTPPPSTLTGDLLNASKIDCPEAKNLGTINKDAFAQITLSEPLTNRVLLNEILSIQGSTSASVPTVTAFIIDSQDKQTSFESEVKGGNFSLSLRFPKEGTFKLGIIPGETGSSIVKEVIVLKNTCIEETESAQLLALSGVSLQIDNGDTLVRWNPATYNLFKVTIQQGGLKKSYFLHTTDQWKPFYRDFAAFQPGAVDLYLRGAKLTKPSLLEPSQILWSPASKNTFLATQHHEYKVNSDEVELQSLTKNSILKEAIKAVFKAKVPVRSKAAVILPNGKVEEFAVTSTTQTPKKNAFGQEVFPASSDPLTASTLAKETALHFLEINNAEGLAVINVPIYVRNQFPLIPTPRDLSDATAVDLGNDIAKLRTQMLALVNKDRAGQKLPALTLDDNLGKLAQYRSDDMVTNHYFGHWDSQGRGANDLRKNYGIQTLVAENLAKDITLELAEYGLMRSAIHRSNILSTEWTRVGFGITKDTDGSYVFVQMFSTNPLSLDDLPALRNSLLTAINQKRGSPLVLTDTLNAVAQTWSQRMADEDFFDFTGKTPPTLDESTQQAGILASRGFNILGNSSFGDAVTKAASTTALLQSNWKNMGIGIKQDNLGIIKITLIYTE